MRKCITSTCPFVAAPINAAAVHPIGKIISFIYDTDFINVNYPHCTNLYLQDGFETATEPPLSFPEMPLHP
jgi:hypothetical protein